MTVLPYFKIKHLKLYKRNKKPLKHDYHKYKLIYRLKQILNLRNDMKFHSRYELLKDTEVLITRIC